MGTPFQANADQLRTVAADWRSTADGFGADGPTPAPPTGRTALEQAIGEMTPTVGATTAGLRDRLTGTADSLGQFGNASQHQDANAAQVMQAVGGLVGPPLQAAAGLEGDVAGTVPSTAAAIFGPLAGLLGKQNQQQQQGGDQHDDTV